MAAVRGNSKLVELSEGQLHKLTEIIHLQEVEKLKEMEFNSYGDQQKYLNDSKYAREHVYDLLENVKKMKADATKEKEEIAHDVYEYCTKTIGFSLQFIRSYNTRLTFLEKLKSHCQNMIDTLRRLDPATQMKDIQRLAIEADMYKKAILDYSRKFQHFVPNFFTRWIKEKRIHFEDLLQDYMGKLGFSGPFKNLTNINKLQVYEKIIEAAGQGKPVVTYTIEALGATGVAMLVFTAGIMVWDIYTAEDKVQAAVRDSVNALTAVVSLEVGNVVSAAVGAGFEALDVEIASMAVTFLGAVAGFGVGVLIGVAAGALLDLIFSSGSAKVHSTDGLTVCRVAPMPDGLQLARLVKHNYPDL